MLSLNLTKYKLLYCFEKLTSTKSIIDKLIKDPIPIVRIALINATFNIRKSMNSDFILDKLLDVIVDTDSKVRIALANVIHHHVFLTDDSKQLKPAKKTVHKNVTSKNPNGKTKK